MAQPTKRARDRAPSKASRPYARIEGIDGRHPLQELVPDFCVSYRARVRSGGAVTYFNFDLAREMGLLDADHPDELNPELEASLLETFGLIIINEWDLENKRAFPESSLKPHPYMATRYLQLQHPNKQGKTSGDGRSVWNGSFARNGVTWDLSSCGTGATRLSPASVIQGKNFKSGDPSISYGCGMADLADGVSAALMSEIFHKGGIPTERTLVVIKYPGAQAIYVRAARNLIRPAHFFRFLKLGAHASLRTLVDHFVARQVSNGDWKIPAGTPPYRYLLDRMAHDFGRSAALFEREYVFCWFDWDGDNILASEAAILDYGSIRQFGLFHKDYRYDDVERWSTNLLEQRGKARYLVQTFAQMCDFLETGRKRGIRDYAESKALKDFDAHFESYKKFYLLRRVGLEEKAARKLLEAEPKKVTEFEQVFEAFERVQSVRGTYRVEDGVSSDAVFCMRDLLRELPKHFLGKAEAIPESDFVAIAKSSYARPKDLLSSSARTRNVAEFQELYLDLLQTAAPLERKTFKRLLLEVTMRSSLINRYDHVTGNGVLRVTEELLKERSKPKRLGSLMRDFIKRQSSAPHPAPSEAPADRKLLKLVAIVEDAREEV